jgi:hypothetical protein
MKQHLQITRFLAAFVVFSFIAASALVSAEAKPPLKEGNPGIPGLIYELESQINELQAEIDMLTSMALVPQTGQTSSYGDGDDGAIQAGVQWPELRFTDNSDGTVTDHLTGLIWLENVNCFDPSTWADALNAANTLCDGGDSPTEGCDLIEGEDCGLTDGSMAEDWRLPNVRELQTLIDYGNSNPALPPGHPFSGVAWYRCWSSTTYDDFPELAWFVHFYDGYVDVNDKNSTSIHSLGCVWPVRGGQ